MISFFKKSSNYFFAVEHSKKLVKDDIKIPNKFDFVIKHSSTQKFSSETKPIEVFKMTIEDYASIKDSILRVSF